MLILFFWGVPDWVLSPQQRTSPSAWTWRGRWCAGRAWACQTWTVTSSPSGSPAAVWRRGS